MNCCVRRGSPCHDVIVVRWPYWLSLPNTPLLGELLCTTRFSMSWRHGGEKTKFWNLWSESSWIFWKFVCSGRPFSTKWTRFAAAAAVVRHICAENRRFNPPTSPARVKSSIFSSLDLLPYSHFHLNLYKREISIKSFLCWSPERSGKALPRRVKDKRISW